jgi:hypothetical protein
MPDDASNEGKKFDAKLFAEIAARAPRPYFREALKGDKFAAKEAISLLLHELALHAIKPDVPVSKAALAYLQNCLERIAKGEDANHAFNLKKKGRALWSYDQKLIVAQLVYQFVRSENSVERAVYKSREILESVVSKIREGGEANGSPYAGFVNRLPEEDQIRGWYFELKEDLARISSYEKASLLHIDHEITSS